MTDSTQSFTEELLATTAADIPAGLRDAMTEVCANIMSVTSAYACRTRRERPDGQIVEGLRVALEPTHPTETMDPNPVEHDDQIQVIEALSPFGIKGVAVLSSWGISAWKNSGVKIFQRERPEVH